MLARLRDGGTPALKVSSYRPTLDDVFLSVTGRDSAHTRAEEMAR